MKTKIFLAAAMSACILLSGCGENANDSAASSDAISETTESSVVESTVSSVSTAGSSASSAGSSANSAGSSAAQSSKAVSSSVQSSAVSVPQKPDYDVPTAKLDENSKIVDTANKTLTVSFTTDIPFRSDIKYYLRIYFTDSNLGESELRYDEPFDISRTSITLKLHEGNNYYAIQFHTDEKDGEHSNQIYQALGEAHVTPTNGGRNGGGNGGGLPSNVQKHNISFYTMQGAMYGDVFEIFDAVPDYSQVNSLLSQGIQPSTIDVDFYLNCPYCGTRSYCGTYSYNYNEGEANLVSLKCDNRNCSLHIKPQGSFICSHID